MIKSAPYLVTGPVAILLSLLALGPAQAQTLPGRVIDDGAGRQSAPAPAARDALNPRARASRQTLEQAVRRGTLTDERLRRLRVRRALRARALRAEGVASRGGADSPLAQPLGASPGAAEGRAAIGRRIGIDGLRNFRGRGTPSNGNTSLRLRPRISR